MSELADSILTSTKKALGIMESDDSFNLDVTLHINAALSDLTQLGVGPDGGITVIDADLEWSALGENSEQTSRVKEYVLLKSRMLFDPPATSFAIAAYERQLEQFQFRISIAREGTDWADPTPPSPPDPDEVVV